jgi:hypothetical protein
MIKRIALFFLIASGVALAQTDDTFYVKQFAGLDVGAKTARAQAACNANTAIPCVIVFDPSLAVYAQGNMPAKCSQCIWQDYRSQSGAAAVKLVDNYAGATADARINSCLSDAIVLGSGTCDARSLTGAQALSGNAFNGITGTFTLLISPNVQFSVASLQTIIAPNSTIATDTGNQNTPLQFIWTGYVGGVMFDIKDAPGLKLQDIGIDCALRASTGLRMNGGIVDTFGQEFRRITVNGCTTFNIDDSVSTNFNVTLTNTGSTTNGTLTSGTFPSNWIGKTSGQENGITGAGDSTFNYSYYGGNRYYSPYFVVTGPTTFTMLTPQVGWHPNVASGVTATLSVFSGAQIWTCYDCSIQAGSTGFATIWPEAFFYGGSFYANTAYGIDLLYGGIVAVNGTSFSGNGNDVYIGADGGTFFADGAWFEQSGGSGMINTAAGVAGWNLAISHSFMQSQSTGGLIFLGGAGAGTASFSADIINANQGNPTIHGSATTKWGGDLTFSTAGLQPIWDSGVFPFVSYGQVDAAAYKSGGTAGYTGTKTAGTCVITFKSGLVTNVTGC